ncbi:hypothetical protein [Cerasicoccus maritimus]|uniref:hypothetical protein n=1 Tax=Cerasicoccus maritimus TaxID=490089 RepID=UPI002852B6CF|nr:hypothetical protein [Cerasicoccus maritimus]
MKSELYVILRVKEKGYDYHAVAASRNVRWAEARLNSLPSDMRGDFHIRPVPLVEEVDEVVAFYDRWAPGGPLALSGFGADPKKKPPLPIEPEERVTEYVQLDVIPEDIFPQTKKQQKAAAATSPKNEATAKPEAEAVAEQPRNLRLYLSIGLAVATWLMVLAALFLSARMRPVVLGTESALPAGMSFPFAYTDTHCIEHAGWLYFESDLNRSGFDRTHGNLGWRVIAQDETMDVLRPQVLSAHSHERTEFSFASGLSGVDQWRKDNFLTITDGYFMIWPDGSQMVYDVGSDRIYGRLSAEVAHELFAR